MSDRGGGAERRERPERPERPGWIGVLGGGSAAAGLVLIGLAYLAVAPVRAHLANIRGDGEVADVFREYRVFSQLDAAPARCAAVRADLEPLWAAHREEYEAIARDPSPTLSHGLRRLKLWSDLRVAWARAIARHEVGVLDYPAYAAAHPHPMDRLLIRDPAAGRNRTTGNP
jgi:hypothetical protein